MIFYPGLHQPSDAKHFDRACVSVTRLKPRRAPIGCPDVLVDSGAFSELHLHGRYRDTTAAYAKELLRLWQDGVVRITAAVAQDYMCEPFMLQKTGLTIADHQRLTIERYAQLAAERLPFKIMPVLQGYAPEDYARHARAYGRLLKPGQWVGVGSVCKRNSRPGEVLAVLKAVRDAKPLIRLHGFGLKTTALADPAIRNMLHSADSMAWSFAARWEGRNRNDWREARAFMEKLA